MVRPVHIILPHSSASVRPIKTSFADIVNNETEARKGKKQNRNSEQAELS